MAMGTGPARGPKAEINVTPLVDVVLVLLIIFMVVTPMLQRGKDVRLPKSHRSDEENKQADPLVLSVTLDKKIWVENQVYDEATLGERIDRELQGAPNRKILLKADEGLRVGDVREVMEMTRKAGARGVSLGVEKIEGR